MFFQPLPETFQGFLVSLVERLKFVGDIPRSLRRIAPLSQPLRVRETDNDFGEPLHEHWR